MPRQVLQVTGLCGALLLASCTTPAAVGASGPPSPLQLATAGDDCPPLTLLAGEYRRAVLAHDVAGVAAFIGDQALQCTPGDFISAEAARRSLADPRSFLSASLFDGALLRSGGFSAAGRFGRESQAELLASDGLVVNVTIQAATSRMPRTARIAYKVPRTAWLEIDFTCRSGRWLLLQWGGLECSMFDQPAAPAPARR